MDVNKAHYISATCIVVKDGKFLITKRSEDQKSFPNKWTVPGGKLEVSDYVNREKDTNEHWYNVVEDAVKREVFEEVGLKVKKVNYLTSMTYIRPDGIPGLILSYYADYEDGEVLLNNELTDHEWIQIDEAKYYDLIEGIYEELLMLNDSLNGDSIGEWKKNKKVLRPLKIGIDLDEVLIDFLGKFIEFYNDKYNKQLRYEDFHSYAFWNVIGGTKEDIIMLVDEFKSSKFFDEVSLIQDSKEIVKLLSNGNELFVITSRHSKYKERTIGFLDNNFGKIFSDVFFTTDFYDSCEKMTKAGISEELGIDIFIEDNSVYAQEISDKGIRVLLMNKPWNKDFDAENVMRVNNWREIFLEINKMRQSNE